MEAGRARIRLRLHPEIVRPCLAGSSAMPAGQKSVSANLMVAAFFVLDGLGIVLGLFLLHRQRCIDDITDLRYRDHPDRARRTLVR
jgi:hypothetical protein